jgi:transposase-like protein
MNCPHCASATTREQMQKTTLGYRIFRCSTCKRLFNERTGTPFTFLEYPTDIVLLVVLLGVWAASVQVELARSHRNVS